MARRLGHEPRPGFYSQRTNPSYGPSFSLKQLGPPPLLERLNQPEP